MLVKDKNRPFVLDPNRSRGFLATKRCRHRGLGQRTCPSSLRCLSGWENALGRVAPSYLRIPSLACRLAASRTNSSSSFVNFSRTSDAKLLLHARADRTEESKSVASLNWSDSGNLRFRATISSGKAFQRSSQKLRFPRLGLVDCSLFHPALNPLCCDTRETIGHHPYDI